MSSQIQILRGSNANIVQNTSARLNAGQPLYNVDKNYLTVARYNNTASTKKPIVTPEVIGFAEDGVDNSTYITANTTVEYSINKYSDITEEGEDNSFIRFYSRNYPINLIVNGTTTAELSVTNGNVIIPNATITTLETDSATIDTAVISTASVSRLTGASNSFTIFNSNMSMSRTNGVQNTVAYEQLNIESDDRLLLSGAKTAIISGANVNITPTSVARINTELLSISTNVVQANISDGASISATINRCLLTGGDPMQSGIGTSTYPVALNATQFGTINLTTTSGKGGTNDVEEAINLSSAKVNIVSSGAIQMEGDSLTFNSTPIVTGTKWYQHILTITSAASRTRCIVYDSTSSEITTFDALQSALTNMNADGYMRSAFASGWDNNNLVIHGVFANSDKNSPYLFRWSVEQGEINNDYIESLRVKVNVAMEEVDKYEIDYDFVTPISIIH